MKKILCQLGLLVLCLVPFYTHAIGEPFTQHKLDTLNQAGEPALVFIHADWCPTCRTQEKILDSLLPTDEFKHITTLKVNFDTQRDVVHSFGVRYQSTFIFFKQGKEWRRVTAETDRERIADMLRELR